MTTKSGFKLPFELQPTRPTKQVLVGDDKVGAILIPSKGFVSVAEKQIVQQNEVDLTAGDQLFALCDLIASENDTTSSEVFACLTSEDQPDYIKRYFVQIQSVMAALEVDAQKRYIIKSFATLKSRVSDEITIEDVLAMNPGFLKHVADFYDAENKGDELEEYQPAADGIEGKDQAVS